MFETFGDKYGMYTVVNYSFTTILPYNVKNYQKSYTTVLELRLIE